MVVYGVRLCEATWYNTIAEFPCAVGRHHLFADSRAAASFTLLFIIEHLTIGPPIDWNGKADAPAAFD